MNTQPPLSTSVSKDGVRGRVWLCAWPSRTKTNKETFEEQRRSHVNKRKTKDGRWLCKRREDSQSA